MTNTSNNAASQIITLKGRGKAAREAAYAQIAPLSFVESLSRQETIDNLRKALGSKPSDSELLAARREWQIGRVASRMPASAMPKTCKSAEQKLAHARDLVLRYAMPIKAGVKARKLRKGMLGYRTETQQRVIRAADEAWSQIKAELGAGTAQTQTERNKAKAKRAAHHTTKQDATSAAIVKFDDLPKGAAMTADIACQYIDTQAAALLAFCNKHAKVVPASFGEAVHKFRSSVTSAMNERK